MCNINVFSILESWLLLSPSSPGVCRNLCNILTPFVLSVALEFLGCSCLHGLAFRALEGSVVGLEALHVVPLQWKASYELAVRAPIVSQQTWGTTESHEQCCRFLSLWLLQWLSPPEATPRRWYLRAFPGETSLVALDHLVCLCFLGFKWLFTIFHVKVQCLISEGLGTAQSLWFWGPQVSCACELD